MKWSEIRLFLLLCVFVTCTICQLSVGYIPASQINSTYTLDGSSMTRTRNKLQNTTNFGINGTVKTIISLNSTGCKID